jgi:cytochrome b subunit of formate dehydrogenase
MKEEKIEQNGSVRPKKRIGRRLLFWTLLLIACVLAIGGGLVVGYVRLGGQPLAEVWKFATWKHLYDLIFL